MEINDALLSYLEELSQLSLSDEEKLRVRVDLQKILGSMSKLSELDTEHVPERSHPFDHTNAFREDVVRDSFDPALILLNAPDKTETCFKVPKTLG